MHGSDFGEVSVNLSKFKLSPVIGSGFSSGLESISVDSSYAMENMNGSFNGF